MKDLVKIIAIIAGAVGAAALLTRKRADGSTMYDMLSGKGKEFGDKIVRYSAELKDRMMPDIKGSADENVFSNTYHRKYYMDDTNNNRIYTDS
ncbi:MAG: hypothetical protein H7096_05795 [Flavobacterium sp.]|nr:hypothetical protein [Pedobacter sp.]